MRGPWTAREMRWHEDLGGGTIWVVYCLRNDEWPDVDQNRIYYPLPGGGCHDECTAHWFAEHLNQQEKIIAASGGATPKGGKA